MSVLVPKKISKGAARENEYLHDIFVAPTKSTKDNSLSDPLTEHDSGGLKAQSGKSRPVSVIPGPDTEQTKPDLTSTQQRFLAWARRMWINIRGPSDNNKSAKVVSLMSKTTNKEIVPLESYPAVVHSIHSKNGQVVGQHLSLASTVQAFKARYAFGRRDFGPTEAMVNDIISQCDSPVCYDRTHSRPMNIIEIDAMCKALKEYEKSQVNDQAATPPDDAESADVFYQGEPLLP